MGSPQTRTRYTPNLSQIFFNSDGHFQLFKLGEGGANRRVLLFLGLLNIVMLIVAVVLGIKCAKVKESSLHVSHSNVTQLTNELNYLQSNYSNVTEAGEAVKMALETVIKNHTQLKVQIEQKKTINEDYQRQIEMLRTEKTHLQSNISALETTCGKCLSGWILHNSSCYFFSYLESPTVKKNWPESRKDCVRRGADLVVIDNQEEQEFVSNSIKTVRTAPSVWENGVWVGLSDMDTEGTWVWINNVTEVEQRYWMDGEPNNHGLQGENCGIVVYSSSNPWKTRYDGNCQEHQLYWTCETSLH